MTKKLNSNQTAGADCVQRLVLSSSDTPETDAVAALEGNWDIKALRMGAFARKLERELKAWRALRDVSFQIVPGEHGGGEERDPSPNSIRKHLAYLQDEWDNAEHRLAAISSENAKANVRDDEA